MDQLVYIGIIFISWLVGAVIFHIDSLGNNRQYSSDRVTHVTIALCWPVYLIVLYADVFLERILGDTIDN